MGLARRVIARSGSSSEIHFVPYSEAYDEGFEELGRRKPGHEPALRSSRDGGPSAPSTTRSTT